MSDKDDSFDITFTELNVDYDIISSDKFIIIDDELYFINPVNLKNIKVTIRNWQKYFTDWGKDG